MKAIDSLRSMDLEDKRKNYPNIPEHALPRTQFTDRTANGLTKCIIRFVRLNGGQAERISVEGRVIDSRKTVTDVIGRRRTIGSVKRIPSSAQLGSADLSATIQGKSVKIEVKIGRDQQSPSQREYQRQVEAAGGIYIIVRNFQQAYDWIQGFIGKEMPSE